MSVNPASLSWPEDSGYTQVQLDPPRSALESELAVAQAELAYAGARRERYGRLPGRDEDICAALNNDVTNAQARVDAAREALVAAGEV